MAGECVHPPYISMNFKTTIVLLDSAGRGHRGDVAHARRRQQRKPQKADLAGRKLFDLESDHVNLVSITDAQGQRDQADQGRRDVEDDVAEQGRRRPIWVERRGERAGDLRSLGRPAKDPGSAAGLEKPRYRVQIDSDDGKSVKLSIGNKAGPDDMYAQVEGNSDVRSGGCVVGQDRSKPPPLKCATSA